jgi:hypothetical protein
MTSPCAIIRCPIPGLNLQPEDLSLVWAGLLLRVDPESSARFDNSQNIKMMNVLPVDQRG